MKIKLVLLGAALALLLVVSATSVADDVYISQQPVYIPECGNATVDILMNATNSTDTWSTRVEFDSECVNITEVNFSGSVTPTNASWGHHDSYIYLGGTNLTATNGNELLLATLTVEYGGIGGCASHLNFTGEEEVERLIAGPPDGNPGDKPRIATIYSAMWVNGSAQRVCGDVDCDGDVDIDDVVESYIRVIINPAYLWAADVNCDDDVDMDDVMDIYIRAIIDPTYELNCC